MCRMCHVPVSARRVRHVSRPCGGAACAACVTSLWRRDMCTSRWRCGVCGMCQVPCPACAVCVTSLWRRGICGMCHVPVAARHVQHVSRPCGGAACARPGGGAACAACLTSLAPHVRHVSRLCGGVEYAVCVVPGAACVPVAAFHNPRHRVHVAAWHVRWVWTLGLGQRLPFVICITPCSPCFRQGDRRGGCLACKWGSWRWPRRPGTRAADRRSPP